MSVEHRVCCTVADSRCRRVSCDGCGTYPLVSSRFLCVPCSSREVDHSIDLCFACFTDNKQVAARGKVHSPDHSVIQFRSVKLRVYRHAIIFAAQYALSQMEYKIRMAAERSDTPGDSDDIAVRCIECKTEVKERPFWTCVTCHNSSMSSRSSSQCF